MESHSGPLNSLVGAGTIFETGLEERMGHLVAEGVTEALANPNSNLLPSRGLSGPSSSALPTLETLSLPYPYLEAATFSLERPDPRVPSSEAPEAERFMPRLPPPPAASEDLRVALEDARARSATSGSSGRGASNVFGLTQATHGGGAGFAALSELVLPLSSSAHPTASTSLPVSSPGFLPPPAAEPAFAESGGVPQSAGSEDEVDQEGGEDGEDADGSGSSGRLGSRLLKRRKSSALSKGKRSSAQGMQGRFSGRLETKEDERRLVEECRLLGPLLGPADELDGVPPVGVAGGMQTLARIVRGIASGDIRQHLENRERRIAELSLRLEMMGTPYPPEPSDSRGLGGGAPSDNPPPESGGLCAPPPAQQAPQLMPAFQPSQNLHMGGLAAPMSALPPLPPSSAPRPALNPSPDQRAARQPSASSLNSQERAAAPDEATAGALLSGPGGLLDGGGFVPMGLGPPLPGPARADSSAAPPAAEPSSSPAAAAESLQNHADQLAAHASAHAHARSAAAAQAQHLATAAQLHAAASAQAAAQAEQLKATLQALPPTEQSARAAATVQTLEAQAQAHADATSAAVAQVRGLQDRAQRHAAEEAKAMAHATALQSAAQAAEGGFGAEAMANQGMAPPSGPASNTPPQAHLPSAFEPQFDQPFEAAGNQGNPGQGSMQPQGSMHASVQSQGSMHAQVQPQGSMHAQVQPQGSMHAQVQPQGSMHAQVQPQGSMHAQVQPQGSMHAQVQPQGSMHAQVQPQGSMHAVQSQGSMHAQVQPQGSMHAQVQPQGSMHAVQSQGSMHAQVQPQGSMHAQVQPQGSMHPGALDSLAYQAQAPPSAENALSFAPQVAEAALGYGPPETFHGLTVRGVAQGHLPPPMHQAPPQVLGHLGAYGGGFGGEQPAPPLLAVQRSTSAEGSEGPGASGGRMPHTPRPSSEAAQTLVAAHLLNGDVVQLLLPQSMVSDAAQALADAQNALGPYLQPQSGLGQGLTPTHSGSHAGMLSPLGPASMLASVLEAHAGMGLGLPPSSGGGQGLVDPGTSTAVGMDGRSV